jgi:hypothetical protein
MAINFNTDPYYDDYSEDKNFHRILFKPGVAVQARELNQLQTILQNQVSRFGNHVFKPGSLVIPGNIKFDQNFNFVKLLVSYNSTDIIVDNFLDREIIGQTSGIRAKVFKADTSTDTDLPTLFVKYLDSGTSKTAVAFAAGEDITTNDTGTTYSATVSSVTPTGKCVGAIISDGVYFIKDSFVRVAANTIILDKYTANSNYKVGLEVTESIKNSDDDESLLDPAIGTYNYFAPGADRYKIDLILSKRAVTETTNADTFIELLRVIDGKAVNLVNKPGYNILADELARRTYDESGDYTVKPFSLKFLEHAKTVENPDGYLNGNDGGNVSLAIAVVGPGKSYVKGYEVETNANRYLTFNKPRESADVTNAVVRTPIGNYVEVTTPYGIPNFTSNLIDVNLYNQYTATPGSTAGTLVGNAKIRGFETPSSNAMLAASTFYTFMFDVNMKAGYTFERDVKQLYHASVADTGYSSPAFTSNIVPISTSTVTGSITLTNGSNAVTGVNTVFTSDLKEGDYLHFSSDAGNAYRVVSITTNSAIVIDRSYPLASISGVNTTRDEAVIVDNDKASYLFPMPNDVIKSLGDITIRTRRVSYGTLSSGIIALSTAVGTTFASRTDQDYLAVVVSGGTAGKLYKINSGNFAFTDAPTNRNISIDLTSYGLTNQDVLIYSTIIKSNPTAKSKTDTASSITLTSQTDCQASVISLGVADVYSIANVRVSANTFGTSYLESNSVDITDYYTLETGQTPTYYGVSKVKLKPGKPAPNGPIKISYSYFTHGTGDYFSTESYSDYENIPEFVDQGIVYKLRDVIDLRPRISNDGANFKNTGAVRTEFLDYANDFQTDYSYYLPRTDKIYITSDGKLTYKEGVSDLNPVEPFAPTDAMPLFVIQHPAYGFSINDDSTFTPVDQRRYTMKDIGKLENRIKNLEYYTTLSLLELDTAVFSVKDSFGLDRYKNGFVVDSFKGHGIGDVRNLDYNISMDFETGELKPAFNQNNYQLIELSSSNVDRATNGYVVKNGTTAMLEYTDEEYIFNELSSTTESINPYDNFTFTGSMQLYPPGDTWFNTSDKPLIYKDNTGAYDTFIPDSVGEATYGSVWNAWKQFWYSPQNTDAVKAVEGGAVITDASITGSSTNAIFPYMRDVSIRFTANKLKPNTKMYAFFNEYNVTDMCVVSGTTANITFSADIINNNVDLITDEKGSVTGVFNYNASVAGFKVPSGAVKFRVTDSVTNGMNKESFADAIFTANGSLTYTEPPRVIYYPPAVQVDYSGPASTPVYTPVNIYSSGSDSGGDSGGGGSSGGGGVSSGGGVVGGEIIICGINTPVVSSNVVTVTNVGFDSLAADFVTSSGGVVTAAQASKFTTYYQDAAAAAGTSIEGLRIAAALNPDGFPLQELRDPNAGGQSFSFKSGPSIAVLNPTSPLADPNYVLPNGVKVGEYLTATNVGLATGITNGATYVDSIKTTVGETTFNKTIMPLYEGTAAAVRDQVHSGQPTADMLSFWQVGVANGTFPETDYGIELAINQYAAAITLCVVETNGAGASAWDTLGSTGVKSTVVKIPVN